MDKRSILAIAIITIIILLLPKYYDLIYDKPVMERERIYSEKDTIKRSVDDKRVDQIQKEVIKETDNIIENEEKKDNVLDIYLDSVHQSEEKLFVNIETPLIRARISNISGGKIIYWYLKKYDTWLKEPVRIIDESFNNGPSINFLTVDGKKINLDNYSFFPKNENIDNIVLNNGENYSFTYYIEINNVKVERVMTFYSDSYHIDVKVNISTPKQLLLNNEYQFGWINGLISNEENIEEEFTYSEAYSSMGDEIEDFDIDSEGEIDSKTLIGNTDWIAIRTKYFLCAIVPIETKTLGVTFGGKGIKSDDVLHKKYDAHLNISKTSSDSPDSYIIYMGPLDHSILTDYEIGIDDLVLSHGWYERTFRAISLPIVAVLKFLYIFIPNYGVVIVIFSILIKIIVYPLTKKSYKSMKEMSRVQPLLAELREKYKSDPQRLNKETMKLYKEHGINPLGGCLPMLLQLPLLGALFIVFRSTIQLRGASFIPGWITDLSRPDTLFTLPFSLPLYGDQFNLLPILMAVSMIFQSKMTMQDPKQKAMVYLMPVFMLLIFNKFPSGLNLYYTLFNVLTIIQQKFTDNKGAEIKAKK
jgi:YidC/Oxa1 family membrane protein insertase